MNLQLPAQAEPVFRTRSAAAVRPTGVTASLWAEADPYAVCGVVVEEAQPNCWAMVNHLAQAELNAMSLGVQP
jgi:hypothetical protein